MTTASLIGSDALTERSRRSLQGWMAEAASGRDRIRAGFPADWTSGDKTGTGGSEARRVYVDLAFGGPMGRMPLIVTAYFEPARSDEGEGSRAVAVLAAVGRIAASSLAASAPASRVRGGPTSRTSDRR